MIGSGIVACFPLEREELFRRVPLFPNADMRYISLLLKLRI